MKERPPERNIHKIILDIFYDLKINIGYEITQKAALKAIQLYKQKEINLSELTDIFHTLIFTLNTISSKKQWQDKELDNLLVFASDVEYYLEHGDDKYVKRTLKDMEDYYEANKEKIED